VKESIQAFSDMEEFYRPIVSEDMRHVKIAEHYKVEAVVKLEKYRAVKMEEAVVKMQQEEEKLAMLQ
jgi:hypothetical protein